MRYAVFGMVAILLAGCATYVETTPTPIPPPDNEQIQWASDIMDDPAATDEQICEATGIYIASAREQGHSNRDLLWLVANDPRTGYDSEQEYIDELLEICSTDFGLGATTE